MNESVVYKKALTARPKKIEFGRALSVVHRAPIKFWAGLLEIQKTRDRGPAKAQEFMGFRLGLGPTSGLGACLLLCAEPFIGSFRFATSQLFIVFAVFVTIVPTTNLKLKRKNKTKTNKQTNSDILPNK